MKINDFIDCMKIFKNSSNNEATIDVHDDILMVHCPKATFSKDDYVKLDKCNFLLNSDKGSEEYNREVPANTWYRYYL